MSQPSYMSAYGQRLLALGYPVIPIRPGTKKPGMWYGGTGVGWTDMQNWVSFGVDKPTEGMVAKWSTFPGAGIGVVCGQVVAVDIDVLDKEVAERVEEVFTLKLGKTRAVRVGKEPKRLLVYKTNKPFPKVKAGCIEVLGQGQQFVAYAQHPDTKLDYRWTDAELHSIPFGMLPTVTEEQVKDAVEAAVQVLPEEMRPKRPPSSSYSGEPGEQGLRAHEDAILSAAEAIINPDLAWDDWNKIGMSLWASTDGSDAGYRAWHDISGRSSKYDFAATDERWASYFRSRPTSVGAGTIFHIARQDGWSPPASLDFHEGMVDTSSIKRSIANLLSKAAKPAAAEPDDYEPEPEPEYEPEPEEAIAEPEPPEPSEGYLFAKPDGSFPYDEWLGDKLSPIARTANWIIDTSMYLHPTFALFNTLALLGTVFGRRYKMEELGTHTNMMCIAVAPSGAGKDHSRKKIKELVAAAGMEKLLSGETISSGSAIISMLAEHPSKLAQLDEMGYFLQGIMDKRAQPHHRDIGKKLLEVYSSSGSLYLGNQRADLKVNERKDIWCPNLCVFGTTTLTTLADAMKSAAREDGTLARFLLVAALSDPEPRRANLSLKPDDSIVEWLKGYHHHAPEGNLASMSAGSLPPTLIPVQWDQGADDMFFDLKRWEHQLRKKYGTIWSRFGENAIKLAMIDAISKDMISPKVGRHSLQKAINLVYWCLQYTEQLLRDEAAESVADANQKQVLKVVKAAGRKGIQKTELLRKTTCLTQRERDEALKLLVDMEKVAEEQVQSRGPGRKAIRYVAL